MKTGIDNVQELQEIVNAGMKAVEEARRSRVREIKDFCNNSNKIFSAMMALGSRVPRFRNLKAPLEVTADLKSCMANHTDTGIVVDEGSPLAKKVSPYIEDYEALTGDGVYKGGVSALDSLITDTINVCVANQANATEKEKFDDLHNVLKKWRKVSGYLNSADNIQAIDWAKYKSNPDKELSLDALVGLTNTHSYDKSDENSIYLNYDRKASQKKIRISSDDCTDAVKNTFKKMKIGDIRTKRNKDGTIWFFFNTKGCIFGKIFKGKWKKSKSEDGKTDFVDITELKGVNRSNVIVTVNIDKDGKLTGSLDMSKA